MKKQDKAYMYKGDIKFINLWLNEEKIEELGLKYSIVDRNFAFKVDKKSKFKFSGNILFNKYPKIVFDKILFNYNKQYYKFNGSILSDKIDINMTGNKLDLAILTGLFNFLIDITGKLDL